MGFLLILTITAEWRLNYQWWELRTNTQLDQVAIDPCTDQVATDPFTEGTGRGWEGIY